MAAVTTDLDTHFVTARIKETLTVHNIGQKLFGEAVLGLSQGSVSELLSKPKPWHMLSIKGREPFIRMQLWLNDPTNVEKLQAIKSERREANKRRRSSMEPEMHHTISHPDKTPPLPPYPLDLPPVFLYPPTKKPRILFSEEQKEALRLAYTLDPYPSTAVMEFLSNELGLSVRTITNWFHNHRMRLKQQQPECSLEPDGSGFSRPPGVEPSAFDPIRFRMLLGQRLAEMCSHQQQQSAAEMSMLPYFADPLQLCGPSYQPTDPVRNTESSKLDLNSDTLDLSVSSQKFPKRQPNPQEGKSLESVHSTTSAESEESKPQPTTSTSDDKELASSTAACDIRDTLCNIVSSTGSSSNHSISSGSNRRKAAAPQWVNPGLDLSPDSDLCSFDDDDDLADYELSNWKEDDAENNRNNSGKQIINGVCVRQTDLATTDDPQEKQSEVVHVVPAPAKDELSKTEREKNIQRIERAIVEQDEGWDFTDSDCDDDTYQTTIQQPQQR